MVFNLKYTFRQILWFSLGPSYIYTGGAESISGNGVCMFVCASSLQRWLITKTKYLKQHMLYFWNPDDSSIQGMINLSALSTLHPFADQKKSEKYIGKQKQRICALFVGLCGGFNIKSFEVKYPYLKLCPDTPTHWKVLLCGSSEVTAGQSYPGQS